MSYVYTKLVSTFGALDFLVFLFILCFLPRKDFFLVFLIYFYISSEVASFPGSKRWFGAKTMWQHKFEYKLTKLS